jgi:hypothetical protein
MSEEELYYEEDLNVQSNFEWNEHGVCVNEKLCTFKCIKKFTAQVKWAKNTNNRWVYGLTFNGLNQGWSEPVLNHSNGYDTEDEAYFASVNRLVYLIGNNNDHCKYDGILRMLCDELPTESNETTNQLTLF